MHVEPLRDRAHGRWRSILPALGLRAEFLTGKNTPCPFCGGRDRWRFINRDGSGNWICNQCGKGDGLALAMRVVGQDFAETAKAVEAVLGEVREVDPPKPAPVSRDSLRRLWRSGVPLRGTPGERYFERRGLEAPPCLRFVPELWYSKTEHSPGILAQIAGPDGKCVNLYRIFITEDGHKAPIEKPKRAMRVPTPLGSAIRLGPVPSVLGLAEGIENARSAFQMSGIATWATCGTEFLENFHVPAGVEELVIFADNDANFAGQRAAYGRANKAVVRDGLRARVEVPPEAGLDWNDVLLRGNP